jgi:hypothetical protein
MYEHYSHAEIKPYTARINNRWLRRGSGEGLGDSTVKVLAFLVNEDKIGSCSSTISASSCP